MGNMEIPGEQISSPAYNTTLKKELRYVMGAFYLNLQQHGFWIFNIAFECF